MSVLEKHIAWLDKQIEKYRKFPPGIASGIVIMELTDAKEHAESLLEEEKKQIKQCAEFWNKGSIEKKYFDEYYQSLKTQQ